MVRRANLLTDGKKRVYSSRYALSSTVYCAHCGDIFRRINWNNRGKKSTVWRCVSRVEKGGPECTARTVTEKALKDAVATAVNDAWARRDTFIPVLKENIRAGMEDTTDRRLAEIDEAIRDKQTDLLNVGRDEAKIEAIGDEIVALREERQQTLTQAALNRELNNRIDDMISFLDKQDGLAEYSESLVRRLVEKITIYDEKITVEFKSGLIIDVDT